MVGLRKASLKHRQHCNQILLLQLWERKVFAGEPKRITKKQRKNDFFDKQKVNNVLSLFLLSSVVKFVSKLLVIVISLLDWEKIENWKYMNMKFSENLVSLCVKPSSKRSHSDCLKMMRSFHRYAAWKLSLQGSCPSARKLSLLRKISKREHHINSSA